MLLTAATARLLLRGVSPGSYPRGGRVHLRLWLAQQISDLVDPYSLAGATWVPAYARLLGNRIGKDVDMHTVPPVTGMLTVEELSLIHISEPTRHFKRSRMPSSA